MQESRMAASYSMLPFSLRLIYVSALTDLYVFVFIIRLICPSCKRAEFSNVLGFTNHCRILHKVKFATWADAITHCGVPVDESVIPADHPCRSVRPIGFSFSRSFSPLHSVLPSSDNVLTIVWLLVIYISYCIREATPFRSRHRLMYPRQSPHHSPLT